MATTPYSKEQLNYFRICNIATDILPQGLRVIFKQEWDNRYRATFGEWKDTPQNGLHFYNGESPGNQRQHARLLRTMKKGNRAEWDGTMLFYAILHSDSIHGLNATVRSSVDDLREFRNEVFAHMPRGQLSDLQFRVAARKVQIAFQVLGLTTVQIQNICKQKSFPTEELQNVMKQVQNFYQELQEKDAKLQTTEEQRQVLEVQLKQDASSFCILPPKPSHEVVTRDCEVAKITQQLNKLNSANEGSLSYVYISGNPGSGKSQLAGLVAKKIYDEAIKDPDVHSFVMTLNAESLETLLDSYVSLARQVKCPDYTVIDTRYSKEMKVEEKINNLRDLIATKIHLFASWLLVVDNVTSVSLVHDFLPQSGNERWIKGQLLITTQDTLSIPSESSFVSHINISRGMEPTDASCFLAKISGIKDHEKEEKVAKALDYQPLALASAATYVKKIRESKGSTTFGWKKYLEKLEKGMRALTEKELTNTNRSYPKSMTAATTLSVERAITSDSVIKNAFTFLSVCSPQLLHLDILMNYILNVDKDLDREEIGIQIQGYSLLLFEERENGVYIRQHQIVHDVIKSVIKEHFESAGKARVVDAAVRSFNHFIDSQLPDSWHNHDSNTESKYLIPHLKALVVDIKKVFGADEKCQVIKSVFNDSHSISHFKRLGKICQNHYELFSAKTYYEIAFKLMEISETCSDEDLASTILHMGSVQHDLGDLQQAKEHCERALDIWLKKLGPEHVHVATTYSNLGVVQHDLGDLEQAKEHYERALDIRLKKLGPEHVHVATTYINLGSVQRDLGDLQQAKEHHERALDIKLKKLGPEHVDVATTYTNLGLVQHDLGDLQQAKEHHERALDIRLKKLGPEHVDVATTYSNLGSVQRDLGDLQQAKEDFEHALDIKLKKLGPNNVHVAITYTNLGVVQYDLGDLQQAKEHLERALDIKLKKLGPEHVDVATTYTNLGLVQHDLGDLQQAKEHHERALDIRLKKLGPEHVHVATTYSNLGSVQRDLGDLQQAKEHHKRALDIKLKKLGPEHVHVATTYSNLGSVQRDLGDLQQAKEHHKRALDIKLKKLGPEHVHVATTYSNLGSVQRDLGDLQQAKEDFEHALDIKLKKLGPNNVHVATTYTNLGVVQYDLGDLQQAKEHHERALDIKLKKLGPEHVDVATTYTNLGVVQRDLGDLEQAKEHYERALDIMLKNLGPEHVDVATMYINLGSVQRDLGDLEQAKEHLERALDIRLKKLGPEHVDVATTYSNLGVV